MRFAGVFCSIFLCILALRPAMAADLGGDCCADLEERVAVLEATVVTKGNRKVSLTLQGHVSRAVYFWDDGDETNAYSVGNKNDQTNFAFSGDAAIDSDWSAGYAITIRLKDSLSDEVNQFDDDGEIGFLVWETYLYLESKRIGKLSIGKHSRVTDTAPENDLSETAIAAYAGVQDLGGAFFLRNDAGDLPGVVWGDLFNHLNGDTANLVRYDTPEFCGLVASVSWGEDDIWDVGLKYAGELGNIKIEASIAYSQDTDENGLEGETDSNIPNNTIAGSVAILHVPSGINALVAFGDRSFEVQVLDNDGVFRTPADQRYIYTKFGWITNFNVHGATAFYGEYGIFEDFVSAGFDPTAIDPTAVAARVTGDTAEVWGAGVVQTIDAAEMQLYVGYRYYDAEFDLVDSGGNAIKTIPFEPFQSVIVGGIIAF